MLSPECHLGHYIDVSGFYSGAFAGLYAYARCDFLGWSVQTFQQVCDVWVNAGI